MARNGSSDSSRKPTPNFLTPQVVVHQTPSFSTSADLAGERTPGTEDEEDPARTTPLQGGVENNQDRKSLRRSISLRRDDARWEKQQRLVEELTGTVETLEASKRKLEEEVARMRLEKEKTKRILEDDLARANERISQLEAEREKQTAKNSALKTSLAQETTRSGQLLATLQSSKDVRFSCFPPFPPSSSLNSPILILH